jgi:hypothetical protein
MTCSPAMLRLVFSSTGAEGDGAGLDTNYELVFNDAMRCSEFVSVLMTALPQISVDGGSDDDAAESSPAATTRRVGSPGGGARGACCAVNAMIVLTLPVLRVCVCVCACAVVGFRRLGVRSLLFVLTARSVVGSRSRWRLFLHLVPNGMSRAVCQT